jgi:hypothetical protein
MPQHNGAASIETNNVERVLADIDADYSGCGVEDLRHGVLLVFVAPCQLRSLAGQEHGRTIPLADLQSELRHWCLFVAGISSFCLASECKLDQAPNCFRAREFVILLLGPAFNFGPERRRKPHGQHRVATGGWPTGFFRYYLFG